MIIDVNLQLSSFSSAKRKSRYFLERDWSIFAENLRDMFEEALVPKTYDNACIAVHVILVQSNGSAKSSIINAVSLALMDAAIELTEPIFSMTAGYLRAFADTPVLDLTYAEETACQGEAAAALLLHSNKIVFLETKGVKMQARKFQALVESIGGACQQMKQKMHFFLQQHYREQVALLNF